jgi:hypothetical protein
MTLHRCLNGGRKLPDNYSCGPLCPAFPSCLPPPSPELMSQLVRLRSVGESEHRAAAATVDMLELLRAAIKEGLAGSGE